MDERTQDESAADTGVFGARRWVRPEIDIHETEREIVIVADVPGVRRETLGVRVEDDDLVVEGRVPGREEAESGLPWGYRRRFRLRSAVDRERISAHLEDGALRVHLPRPAAREEHEVKEVPVE